VPAVRKALEGGGKMSKKKDKNSYKRKASLLASGWKETKDPNVIFKTVGNTTFFVNTATRRTWVSTYKEGENE